LYLGSLFERDILSREIHTLAGKQVIHCKKL
jgi:hypothetical protein